MPTRLVREGFLRSDRVAKLSADEERLYFRLILVVDDYGLCDARPIIMKAEAFPLHPKITEAEISKWLAAIERAGLGERYEVATKPYFYLYNSRNRLRAKKPKFPLPPERDRSGLISDGHMSDVRPAHAPGFGFGDGFGDGGGGGKKRRGLPPLNPRPNFLPPNWETFEAQRAKSKTPMSAVARDELVRKIGRLVQEGYDVAAIVQESIEHDWRGLFEKPKHKLRKGQPTADAISKFLARDGRKA